MPVAFTESMVPAQPAPPRKRWTREDCEVLEALGWPSGENLELIEGDLIEKMGKKPPHTYSLSEIADWLREVFGSRFVLQEAPIDVAPLDNPSSKPEPDLVVLNRDRSHFKSAVVAPKDLRLVVEVADASLAFDLTTKARLYARAGIAEYWVVDVNGKRIVVHRKPASGRYELLQAYAEYEIVSAMAAPQAGKRVGDLLGA